MALTSCHECGQSISTSAMACPNCGAGRPFSPQLKAGAAIAFLVSFCILLSAWNNRPADIDRDNTNDEPDGVALEREVESLKETIEQSKAAEVSRRLKQQQAEFKRRSVELALEAAARAREEKAALENATIEARRIRSGVPNPLSPQSPQADEYRPPQFDPTFADPRRALEKAVAKSEYRRWVTFGGKPVSEAKITDYKDGVVTLTNHDRKSVEVRISRFLKVDREYIDQWLSNAKLTP